MENKKILIITKTKITTIGIKLSLMVMMDCFCGMVDRRKALSLISSRDHRQRSSPSQISDTLRAGFEPAQNLSSGFVKWSCAVMITTTPRCQINIHAYMNIYARSHALRVSLFSIRQYIELDNILKWCMYMYIQIFVLFSDWRIVIKLHTANPVFP